MCGSQVRGEKVYDLVPIAFLNYLISTLFANHTTIVLINIMFSRAFLAVQFRRISTTFWVVYRCYIF